MAYLPKRRDLKEPDPRGGRFLRPGRGPDSFKVVLPPLVILLVWLLFFLHSVHAEMGLELQDFELQTPASDATSVKIQIKKHTHGNKTLRFAVKNNTGKLLNNIYFVLFINDEKIGDVLRLEILPDALEEDIRFDLPNELTITQDTGILLRAEQHFEQQGKIKNKVIAQWSVGPASGHFNASLTAVLTIFGIMGAYLALFFHPLTQTLSKNPARLLALPLPRIRQTTWLLRLTWQLDSVLENNELHRDWLDTAIAFKGMDAVHRSDVLAKRLNAKSQPVSKELFEFIFSTSFPLNLTACTVYFPSPHLPAAEIVMRLQQDDLTEKFVLVVAPEHSQFSVLRKQGEDRTTLWIVPDSRDLTALLLSPEPVQIFVKLLSSQLAVTSLSPYQTSGGVKKESGFFGRERILTEILNREPANYLLLGGRQLGKTSLLKQIVRRYHNHPVVECHYLSLSSDNLLKPLARELSLPRKSEPEAILEALEEVPAGKRRLLLIDEADKFIRAEMDHGYPVLSRFRALSEEGRCFFILAGFWELYEAALLDYHSPLQNFAKPVIVGELENDACRRLATEPMDWLGIHYADPTLVEQIVTLTGQRANLIALACDEMLKAIGPRRVLNSEDVHQALSSAMMESALSGWTRLTSDEAEARLDRMIVYGTVQQTRFSLEEITGILQNHGMSIDPERLNQSSARLKLAFILRETEMGFEYCVPLFQQLLRKKGLDKLLESEDVRIPL